MRSVKLSVTCGKRLTTKYAPKALTSVKTAIRRWIVADKSRGIRTIHLELDDPAAMKPFKVRAIVGEATAQKVKTSIDALVERLSPDYIVIIGATTSCPPSRCPT